MNINTIMLLICIVIIFFLIIISKHVFCDIFLYDIYSRVYFLIIRRLNIRATLQDVHFMLYHFPQIAKLTFF